MFRKETEFQETAMGEFPKEWEVRRLDEIAELQRGLSYSSKEKSVNEIPDGYLFLTLNSVKEGGGLKEDGWTWIKSDRLEERHFVKEGDIVIANTEQSKDGSLLGSPAIVHFPEWYKKGKAVFSMDLSKLLLRISNIDVDFLFYYLSFVQPLARKYHTGTNVWHLNLDSWARDLLIPLPPLEEQKRIADVLLTVDSGIGTVDRAVAKLEGMKRTLLNELLTGRIRVREENGKLTFYEETEFQDTEIGEIPKEWKVVSLEDVSLMIRTGPFGSQLKKSELSESGIKVYTQENVLKNDFSLGNLYISYNKFEQLKNMEVKPGDVLLTIRGSIGYSAVFPEGAERGIIHTNLAYIRVKISLLSPKYLSLLINYHSSIKSQLITLSSATTLGALYAKNIKKIKIPLPPLLEQQKIVEILSMIDKAIELYREEKERLLRLRRGLMSVLLTGRVRVIGDVRDVGIVA
jgi:type I restriction enzyme S subunit